MPANIFDRLIQDHDKHRKLLDAIADADGDAPERRELFESFKIDSKAHAASEEVTLYSELMGEVAMREYARHAAADHHEIDEAISAVEGTEFGSSAWRDKFAKLKETYLDHLREEEETIFPDALKDIGEERAVQLKDEFNRLKPEEIERQESGADDKISEKIG
jgi:hypothetical protein